MADPLAIPNSLLTVMKRRQASMVSVFADSLAHDALSLLRESLDGIHLRDIALEFPKEIQVERFLGSSSTDPLNSILTTRQIAVAAYRLAGGASTDADRYSIGLAISNANRATTHIVLHSQQSTQQCTIQWPADASDALRAGELLSLVVKALAHDFGMTAYEHNQTTVHWQHEPAHPDWLQLVSGKRQLVGTCPSAPILFPGSFHPIHDGHRQMVAVAADRLGQPVHLEISVTNADKPELDYLTIGQRVRSAESIAPIVLTQAPRFVDKARLFPGAVFIIGADTAMRLDSIRFYDHSPEKRDAAVADIANQQCRFLVFGRLVEQAFCEASKLSLTRQLRDLCEFVPTTEFRVDISSRDLRSG